MSDETIRINDLVMVVSGMRCCGTKTGQEGKVFKVISINKNGGFGSCIACGKVAFGLDGAKGLYGDKYGTAIDVDRLKKINPPPVDETVRESDEVAA